MKTVDFQGKPFHFIGIGGIGMSALAYILAKRKLPVAGSDVRKSHITERLESVGAHIFTQQEASNLEYFQSRHQKVEQSKSTLVGAGNRQSSVTAAAPFLDQLETLPQVICSTAIGKTNPEYSSCLTAGMFNFSPF